MRSRTAAIRQDRWMVLAATPHNFEAGIIAADGLSTQAPLRGIVVDAQVAVASVGLEVLPLGLRIRDGLADRALGQGVRPCSSNHSPKESSSGTAFRCRITRHASADNSRQ